MESDTEALDGVNTCAPSVGQMVPRADRIVLALQIAAGRDYERFCKAGDLIKRDRFEPAGL